MTVGLASPLPIKIAKARDVLLALADADPKLAFSEIYRLVALELHLELVAITEAHEIEADRSRLN